MDYWILEDRIILGDTSVGLSCVQNRGNLQTVEKYMSYFVAVTNCVVGPTGLYLVFD